MILERLARTLEGPSRGPFFMAQALRYLTGPAGHVAPWEHIQRERKHEQKDTPWPDLFGGCWEAREAAIAELEAAARAVQGVRS
jgi:hypothetical protein